MEYFIQQLVNGITLGSIYGLIAIGYTMVYGIIGMINFLQDSFLTIQMKKVRVDVESLLVFNKKRMAE